MKYLQDDNFPKEAVSLLGSLGHGCRTIQQLSLRGRTDEVALQAAVGEDAIF